MTKMAGVSCVALEKLERVYAKSTIRAFFSVSMVTQIVKQHPRRFCVMFSEREMLFSGRAIY